MFCFCCLDHLQKRKESQSTSHLTSLKKRTNKHPYSGRYGFTAEMMRQYYKATLKACEKVLKEEDVTMIQVSKGKKTRLVPLSFQKEILSQLEDSVHLKNDIP